jgi:hypothetical protein
MRRWAYGALGLLAMSAVVGCAAQTGSVRNDSGGPGAAQKTIVLGATRIEPDNFTMASTDVIAFTSTAFDPLQLEFIKPTSQAGKINCRVADPKSLKPGETPWATFSVNGEGHFVANVPPGQFPSVCTLAPGSYTYVVHQLSAGPGTSEGRLGLEGNITVR